MKSTSRLVKKKTHTTGQGTTATTRKPLMGDYRQNSFETRYSSMIAKQILDTNVNHEELKKQLHIFMPYNAAQHEDITTKKIIMDRENNKKGEKRPLIVDDFQEEDNDGIQDYDDDEEDDDDNDISKSDN